MFFSFSLKLLSCRVSHVSRVSFTQRESFKNYSPQSGTVILKLFVVVVVVVFVIDVQLLEQIGE